MHRLVYQATAKPVNGNSSVCTSFWTVSSSLVRFLIESSVVGSVVFLLFAGSLYRTFQLYLSKQIETLTWTDERAIDETTYYHRVCSIEDLTAPIDATPIFLNATSSSQNAYDTFLRHGFVFFPQILSRDMASTFRDFSLRKNAAISPNGGNSTLISPKNRWLITPGLDEDPIVARILEEVSNHPQLSASLEHILGPNPALIEFDVITSAPGAEEQHLHSDGIADMSPLVAARSFAPAHLLLIQLQDTTPGMGVTQIVPGTHFCAGDWHFLGEVCEQHTIPVIDSNLGYWPAGGAVLMNTNSWHRGGAYTDQEGPHRAMLVLTFSSQPQQRAESRMLTQGLSYSLPWYMWGHTLKDLQQASSVMKPPFTYARALGLFSVASDRWGVDFVTLWLRRMANDYEGTDEPELIRTYLEESDGWFELGLKWLHGGVPRNVEYLHMCEETLTLMRTLAKKITGTVTSLLLLHYFWILVRPAPGANSKTSQRLEETRHVVRLAALMALVLVCFATIQLHLDRTNWAADIKQGRAHRITFHPIEQDHLFELEPTTIPTRHDVLLETRFGSPSLAMYNDFISLHPGNRQWKSLLRPFVSSFASLGSSLKVAVADSINNRLQIAGCRFLYQNHGHGNWHVLTNEQALDQTLWHLELEASVFKKAFQQAVRFGESTCKYGFRRDTALCRHHDLHRWRTLQSMLIGGPGMKSWPNKNGEGEGQVAVANLIVFPTSSSSMAAKQKATVPLRSFTPVQSKHNNLDTLLPSEPSQLSEPPTFKQGDHVLAFDEGEGYQAWIEWVSPTGVAGIRFDDGTRQGVDTEDLSLFDNIVHVGRQLQYLEEFNDNGRYWKRGVLTRVDKQAEMVEITFAKDHTTKFLPFSQLWRMEFWSAP